MAGLLWLKEAALRRSWDAWLKASGGDKVFTMDKLIRTLREEEAASDSASSVSWAELQAREQMIERWAREDG